MAPASQVPAPTASFDVPGPGSWTLDTAHFPRPATRFTIELFPEPARRGFREATARYGLLLDHIDWAFVHRWAYLSPRPVWAPDGAPETLTRSGWDDRVRSTPDLAARLQTSARVFEDRSWRADVRHWDETVKPDLHRGHLGLQAIDPSRLDAAELRAHVDCCAENLRRAVYHHHRLNVAPVIPAGDLLVHAQEWTGRAVAELVGLVREPGTPGLGPAGELARLVEALRDDPAAAARLHDDEPGAVLAALCAGDGRAGRAAAGYLDTVGHWSAGSGSDVGEPSLAELPDLLLRTIRAALDGPGARAAPEESAEVRAAIPPERRATFDGLLAEARASHRLRDERAIYCDVWAYGLARRAILAAGARLAEAGAIERPEHLVEAGRQEVQALLETGRGAAGEELAERARYRAQARAEAAPALLGGPPRAPVPPAWLPPGAARTERAFRAYVGAMSAEAEVPGDAGVVRGLAAGSGIHEGRARVLQDASQLARVERGDVLVVGSTTPAFNVVLPLVGALVTDRGGLLSHAAIVAREYGIPAVVGTGDATRRIPDGARVRVDGAAGEARVLG